MKKTSSYWDKRAIERLTDSEKLTKTYIERIKKIYNQAYKNIQRDLDSVYKNYSKDTGLDVQKLKELLTKTETDKTWKTLKRQGLDKYIKNNYKSRISRLEQIQAQIYAKAKLIYPKEELENTMCYKGVINDSYYKAVYDTQMGTGYDFSFNKIDNNMLNALLNENWTNKHYSERIWNNTDILADSISQIIGGALISGQSIEKTSKQLRDRFKVGKYYAERLARTESNYFHNQADAMAYEEMGVDTYVFMATLDSRTSVICQEHDNKRFKYKDLKTGYNYPPLHPNCRSTTRGYIGEEVEKTLQRRARNPITGENELVDNISYSEWMKKNQNNIKLSDNDKNNQLSLTKDERYAINTYVSSDSYVINEALRNGTTLDERLTKVVKDLDTALDKFPNYEGVVTRSVSIYSEDIDYFLKRYPEGEIMSHNEFLSTTVGDTYNPEVRVQMYIKSKTGKDIRKYNELEQEVLFKRNVKFRNYPCNY